MEILVNMSQSHIQRYSEFLSRPTSSPLPEKNLSASDIDALIAKGEEVVKSIMRDNKKTSEEKKTAQSVLSSNLHGKRKSPYIQMLLLN